MKRLLLAFSLTCATYSVFGCASEYRPKCARLATYGDDNSTATPHKPVKIEAARILIRENGKWRELELDGQIRLISVQVDGVPLDPINLSVSEVGAVQQGEK